MYSKTPICPYCPCWQLAVTGTAHVFALSHVMDSLGRHFSEVRSGYNTLGLNNIFCRQHFSNTNFHWSLFLGVRFDSKSALLQTCVDHFSVCLEMVLYWSWPGFGLAADALLTAFFYRAYTQITRSCGKIEVGQCSMYSKFLKTMRSASSYCMSCYIPVVILVNSIRIHSGVH